MMQAGPVQFTATQDGHGNHGQPQTYKANPPTGSVSLQSEQPAMTQRTVLVIAFPGYGGTPRTDFSVLTRELIGLLKQATIYRGYLYSTQRAIFLGQDGASYAGESCNVGTAPDNIHIRVEGLPADRTPISYRVEDPAGGGGWASPCNPVTSWQLHAIPGSPGVVDLYFKPFRDAPAGTRYNVIVRYGDGTNIQLVTIGTRVQP